MRNYVSDEYKKVVSFLKGLKFRRVFFGGIDEKHVWQKLEELSRLYDRAVEAERISGRALISEYKQTAYLEIRKRDEKIAELEKKISDSLPEAQAPTDRNYEKQ